MIRDSELFTKQWQSGISQPTYSPSVLAKEAFALFRKSYSWNHPIRSVTVLAINLAPADCEYQLTLDMDAEKLARAEAIDKTVDDLRMRYGKNIIRNACLLRNHMMSDQEHAVILPSGVPH